MSPLELERSLDALRWTPDTLARALECHVSLVQAWLDGNLDIPLKAGVWIKTLAAYHEAAERLKPKGLKGKKFVQ
ncbi:MAG TPA: hypothetical protein VMF90_12220 [Rhizobiaceae bacterium]|nr:hypothetical protein [Rhizobiaceae bacterium]